ncbi:unnamed protein product [Rhodiola kirilowii]
MERHHQELTTLDYTKSAAQLTCLGPDKMALTKVIPFIADGSIESGTCAMKLH